MPLLKPRLLCLAGNPELQDRVETFSDGDRQIVALADGAGGISGGAQAADAVLRIVSDRKSALLSAEDCETLLHDADPLIANDPAAGETTAIVLVAKPGRVFGASIGDSEAWLFSHTTNHLTKAQQRKPLLGSNESLPFTFTLDVPNGLLLIATDGLWKYTSHEKIAAQIQLDDLSTLPDRLANLVRLRSGTLQDDLAMAIISFD